MFPQVTEWLGKKAGSLSGGQQRLVEFARCLMLDPSLVILDEPSMGLSPLVLKSVFDAVRMMNKQGKTILLVEQNARAGLRLSTHGVVLENGRVRLSGSGHEVLHHPEIGAMYLGGAVTDTSGPASAPENANVAAVNAAAAEIAAADAEPGGSDATANGGTSNGGASNGTATNGTAAR
jgi:branched-chain amino acid transport system ATP-binding protein